MLLLKILTLVGMLASVGWVAQAPGWESIAAACMALGTFIGLDIHMHRKMEKILETRIPDRALFELLKTTLPSGGAIKFIKDVNMAFPQKENYFKQLVDFVHSWNDPEHEFLDSEIEEKRRKLLEYAKWYLTAIEQNTVVDEEGFYRIPDRIKLGNRPHLDAVIARLNDLAGQLVSAHEDLLRYARQKLRV